MTSARRVNVVLSFTYFASYLQCHCVERFESFETSVCSVFEISLAGPSVRVVVVACMGLWTVQHTRAELPGSIH